MQCGTAGPNASCSPIHSPCSEQLRPPLLVSVAVLALQLQVSEGGFRGGLWSILSTLGRRTYASPDLFPAYAESLRANPWSVLWTYIAEDNAIGILGVRFLDLILVALGITVLYLVLQRLKPGRFSQTSKSRALITATWISLLSPLSWFFLFKGQAYVHTHTNYLAWHMPFALYAYLLCAWLVERLLDGLLASSQGISHPARGRSELITRLAARHKNTRGRGGDRGCFYLIRYAGKLTFGSSCMAAFTACSG